MGAKDEEEENEESISRRLSQYQMSAAIPSAPPTKKSIQKTARPLPPEYSIFEAIKPPKFPVEEKKRRKRPQTPPPPPKSVRAPPDRSGRRLVDSPVSAAIIANEKQYHEWKHPNHTEILQTLSPIQRRVTQRGGSEPPFKNDYWNHSETGIYIDIISGEPLFSSTDKLESRLGYPVFCQPLEGVHLHEIEVRDHGFLETQVYSWFADSHLGRVLERAPRNAKHCDRHYVLNSAALRFVSSVEMSKKGLGNLRTALFS